eukprot:g18565.t1
MRYGWDQQAEAFAELPKQPAKPRNRKSSVLDDEALDAVLDAVDSEVDLPGYQEFRQQVLDEHNQKMDEASELLSELDTEYARMGQQRKKVKGDLLKEQWKQVHNKNKIAELQAKIKAIDCRRKASQNKIWHTKTIADGKKKPSEGTIEAMWELEQKCELGQMLGDGLGGDMDVDSNSLLGGFAELDENGDCMM